MRVVFTKGSDRDSIDVQRADGTTTTTRFPKKGVIPHDAVHLIVERTLGLRNAFWGLVNAGANPADVAQMSKDGGHASASRAGVPDPAIVEMLQAERLVECIEADMWSEPATFATFLSDLNAACSQSHIAAPDLSEEQIKHIRIELKQFMQHWKTLSVGQTHSLKWEQ